MHKRGANGRACAGIFVPSLAVGGALGRLVGMAVSAALQTAGSAMQVSLPAYAVCFPTTCIASVVT